MSVRKAVLLHVLAWFAAAAPAGASNEHPLAPEVYRSPDLVVRAGIATRDGQIVHFGDVLTLVVFVSWNEDALVLEKPGERFFSEAWAMDPSPVVIERQETRGPGSGGYTDELRYVWRFQLVSCPGGAPTCPGDRHYPMPEFALRYRAKGGEPAELRFRPAPQALTVLTAIARDEEGRLYPFPAYFPSGAYPDPLPVDDRTHASLAAFGIGSLIFIGGMLMWPLRFRRKQLFAAGERPRWKNLLLELQDEHEDDERRLADRMRRCLVWYCSDALGADPLHWLARDKPHDEAHAEFRDLFLDLLHDPSGRSAELRGRLTALVTDRA